MKIIFIFLSVIMVSPGTCFSDWNKDGAWVVESGDNPYDIAIRKFNIPVRDVNPEFIKRIIRPGQVCTVNQIVDMRTDAIDRHIRQRIELPAGLTSDTVTDHTVDKYQMFCWYIYQQEKDLYCLCVSKDNILISRNGVGNYHFSSVSGVSNFIRERYKVSVEPLKTPLIEPEPGDSKVGEREVAYTDSLSTPPKKVEEATVIEPIESIQAIELAPLTMTAEDQNFFEIGLKLQARHLQYDQCKRGDDEDDGGYSEIAVRPDLKFSIGLAYAYAEIEYLFDTEDEPEGLFQNFNETNRKKTMSFKQGFFFMSGYGQIFSVGKKIINWSKVEFSPADIAPIDWSMGYARKRRPLAGVTWENEHIRVFYSPFSVPPLLPHPDDRWSKELPEGVSLGEVEYDREKAYWAVRLEANLRNTEFSVGYRDGYSGRIGYELLVGAEGFIVSPKLEKAQVISVTAVKDWLALIRFEAGYFLADTDREYLRYVFGLEYEWNYTFGLDWVFLIVEYMREESFVEPEEAGLEVTDFSSLYNNNLMTRLEISPRDDWPINFLCESMYSFKGEDGMILPRLIYRGTHTEIEFGYLVLFGKKNYFWRSQGYDRNNAFYFQINYIPF